MSSPQHSLRLADSRRGFTLIELLIGAGLGVMVIGVMIPIVIHTAIIVETAHAKSQQLDWMTGALYQIKSEAAQMTVDTTASTPTQLVLSDPVRPIVYDSHDGKIRRRRGAGTMYLTPNGFPLSLHYTAPAGSSEARVRITHSSPAAALETTLRTTP